MSPRGFSVKCPSAPVPGARFFPGTLFIRRSGSVRILPQRVPPRSASSPVRPTRPALLSAMRLRPGLSEPSFLPPRPPRTFPFSCNGPPGIFPRPADPPGQNTRRPTPYMGFSPPRVRLSPDPCVPGEKGNAVLYTTRVVLHAFADGTYRAAKAAPVRCVILRPRPQTQCPVHIRPAIPGYNR